MSCQTASAIKLEKETEMVNVKLEEGEVKVNIANILGCVTPTNKGEKEPPVFTGKCFQSAVEDKRNKDEVVVPAPAAATAQVNSETSSRRESLPRVCKKVRLAPKISIPREVMSRVRANWVKKAEEAGISVKEFRKEEAIRLNRLYGGVVV